MNILLVIIFIFEVMVLYGIIRRYIKQTEIVDLKSTKYFIPVLLINLALYAICLFTNPYEGSFIARFNECLRNALDSCFLKFDFEVAEAMVATNQLFAIDFYFAYFLTALTLIFVALALVGRFLENFIKLKFKLLTSKELIVVIGYNEDAINFLRTIKNKDCIVWLPTTDKAKRKELMTKKEITVIFDDVSLKAFNKFKKLQTTYVCFIEDSEQMLKIIGTYVKAKRFNSNLYVSIDNKYDEAFKNAYNAKNVMFFNKYSLVAQKFVSSYPITSLLKENCFDYNTATVKNDVELNVFVFGFGYTNRNTLYSMMIDNQIPTIRDGKFCVKKVHYHIFDKSQISKNDNINDKTFNYNLTRFLNLCKNDKSKLDFYPLPDLPFDLSFYNEDITSVEFQNTLQSIINRTDKSRTYNFAITSLGDDLENIDNTIRIRQFMIESGAENNQFFIRLKKKSFKNMIEFNSDLTAFGEYEILNYETIVSENLNRLSVDMNFANQLKHDEIAEQYEYINTIASVRKQTKELEKLKLQLWNRLNLFDKEFSSYNSLNIRTKLNLLGLDTVGSSPISNKKYFELYDREKEMIVKNRVKIYTFPYPTTLTPRNSLAFQEHLHNIAFLIIKGYLPFKKCEIFNNKNDSYINLLKDKRLSINLTTFDALNNIIKERLAFNPNLLELDLKMPLYQIMDNLPLYKYTNYIIYEVNAKGFK